MITFITTEKFFVCGMAHTKNHTLLRLDTLIVFSGILKTTHLYIILLIV